MWTDVVCRLITLSLYCSNVTLKKNPCTVVVYNHAVAVIEIHFRLFVPFRGHVSFISV